MENKATLTALAARVDRLEEGAGAGAASTNICREAMVDDLLEENKQLKIEMEELRERHKVDKELVTLF